MYGPPFGINYAFYIDDLMMPATDEYGVKSANELIRQWFDYGGWYDHIAPEHRKIEDIQFVGCITTYGNLLNSSTPYRKPQERAKQQKRMALVIPRNPTKRQNVLRNPLPNNRHDNHKLVGLTAHCIDLHNPSINRHVAHNREKH